MRLRFRQIAAFAVVLVASTTARAHLLECEKTVNEETFLRLEGYPVTLHYELTVRNIHPTSVSIATSASDPLLEELGFEFEPAAPFPVPFQGEVSDTFDVLVRNEAECLALAALDGNVDNRIDNVFEVTWNSGPNDTGADQCHAAVVCEITPPPPPAGATRTLGFWKTHETPLAACIAGGPIDLGFIEVDTLVEALGILWANTARFDADEDRERRSDLDQARIILARQLLVAVCNERVLEADAGDLIEDAVAALAGTDCDEIRDLIDDVTDFNESDDDGDPPAGFVKGPATPKHARSIADDPTSPSGETCGG